MRKGFVLCLLFVILLTGCRSNGPTLATPTIQEETESILQSPTAVEKPANPKATPKSPTNQIPDQTPTVEIVNTSVSPESPASSATTAPTLASTPVAPTATAPLVTQAAPTTPTWIPVPDSSRENIFGLQAYNLSSESPLSRFKESGALWNRIDAFMPGFRWDEIEPVRTDPPTYLWEKVDEAAILSGQEAGMQYIGILAYAPEWALKYSGISCGPYKDTEFERFASFAEAVVARYSQPPFNVKYWEIGNEPEMDHTIALFANPVGFGCWGENTDTYFGGGYYAEMLKIAYPRMKAANSEINILVGGMLLDCDPVNPPLNSDGSAKNCSSSRFLEGILENGGGDFLDGVSFHAYDYYGTLGEYFNYNWSSSNEVLGPVLVAKARYLRSLLESYGYQNKLLMNTEVALICGNDQNEPECQTDEFNLTKSYYIAEVYAAAMAEGLDANIWYHLTGWRASRLVDGDYQPLQAYTAYQISADNLSNAIFVAEIGDFDGIKVYEFERDGKRLWVLWSITAENTSITLPRAPSSITSVFGESLSVSRTLDVTAAPLYVEFIP